MISPSSLAGFNWSSVALQGGVSASEIAPDASNPASEDSFQNFLAQAATPDSVLPPVPASWTNTNSQIDAVTPSTAAGVSARPQRDKATPTSSQSSDRANPKYVPRMLPLTVSSEKQEAVAHATQVETSRTSGSAVPDSIVDQTMPSQAETTPTAASNSLPTKKGSFSSGSEQNGLSAAAISALGGLKNLSGNAFAMHITPAASQGNNSPNLVASNNGATPDSAVSGGSTVADPLAGASGMLPASGSHTQTLGDPSNSANPPASALLSWVSPASIATPSDQAGSAQPAPTTAEVSESAFDEPSGAPQPVHTVQLQLAGEGEGRVDVRLVEHAGGLSVSVRASDSTLTRGLQENLPELSARLAADKYQTHTLLPSANEASGGSSSGSSGERSAQAQEQSGGRSFSQGDSASGGNGGGRQQNQQAAWWRQMAALGKLSTTASSSLQGFATQPEGNPQAINQ